MISKEIDKEFRENKILPDYFVCSIGSGGTIMGISKRMKELNPNIKIVAVDLVGGPLISKYNNKEYLMHDHSIASISPEFIPNIIDLNIIDEVIEVNDSDVYEYLNEVYIKEGILLGESSGVNLLAIEKLILNKNLQLKNILTVCADNILKYI